MKQHVVSNMYSDKTSSKKAAGHRFWDFYCGKPSAASMAITWFQYRTAPSERHPPPSPLRARHTAAQHNCQSGNADCQQTQRKEYMQVHRITVSAFAATQPSTTRALTKVHKSGCRREEVPCDCKKSSKKLRMKMKQGGFKWRSHGPNAHGFIPIGDARVLNRWRQFILAHVRNCL